MRRPRPLHLLTLAAVALLTVALTAPVDAAPAIPDGTAPSAAPAQAKADSFTKRAVAIPVKVGPKRDFACTIAADLYRPRGVDGAHPAPAILTTNGFGGAKDDANQSGIGRGFAKEGYVVLSYS